MPPKPGTKFLDFGFYIIDLKSSAFVESTVSIIPI
jgi:hypothetical protein